MRKVILAAILIASLTAVAPQSQSQQPAAPSFQTNVMERTFAPTYSDLYCSGFITKENINRANHVAGGVQSPNATFFVTGTQIYIAGTGLQEGTQLSVLRELKDPNRYEPYKGQRADVAALGQPYADIGRVRIVGTRGSMAIAEVEFTCQNITVGDIVAPYREHQPLAFRKASAIEKFPAAPGRVSGKIVMAREFDTELGQGQKVYINAGADKGVKVGDYFRAIRNYDPAKLDPADASAYSAPVGDDTQKVPGRIDKNTSKEFPTRAVGELIVLEVTPNSSTAMITNVVDVVLVGDQVELEGQ